MRSRRLYIGAILAALPLAACILDWDSLGGPPITFVDAGQDTQEPPDTSVVDTGPDTTTVNDSGPDTSCVPVLLVNEVQTEGSLGPSDEFVEIYNAGSCNVSLNQWTLQYSSSTASPASLVWTGQPADVVDAGGYAVVGGQQFQGNAIGRFGNGLNGVLSKVGGGVGLFAPNAPSPTDSVAWATISAATHPFDRPTSGPPAPNPPVSQSIARTPNGANSGASAVDFKVATTPTPGKAN